MTARPPCPLPVQIPPADVIAALRNYFGEASARYTVRPDGAVLMVCKYPVDAFFCQSELREPGYPASEIIRYLTGFEVPRDRCTLTIPAIFRIA